jgi:hypothetical protein
MWTKGKKKEGIKERYFKKGHLQSEGGNIPQRKPPIDDCYNF